MLSCIAFIVASVPSTKPVSEYKVILKPKVSVESLAKFGRVVQRNKRLYTVELTDDQRLRLKLSGITTHLRNTAILPNYKSVLSVEGFVRSVEIEAKASGQKQPELGGIEGYLWYLKLRSLPYDTFDESKLTKAAKFRDEMPSPSNSGRIDTSAWSYLGPTNLDTPQRMYAGRKPVSGRINAVAWDPINSDTLWAAAPIGGVWKSTNGGLSWVPLGDKFSQLHVSSLAVNPLNSDWVYAGTGDYDGGYGSGHGIMRTTDGGATWTEFAATDFGTLPVTALTLDPTNPLIVCAATGSKGGVNGGYIWRNTLGGSGAWTKAIATSAQWSDLRIGGTASTGSRIYWAAGVSAYNNFLYFSTDAGASWTSAALPSDLSRQARLKIAPSRLDFRTLYLLAPSSQKIYKTTNLGASWTDISTGFPNGTTEDPTYNWSQMAYDSTIETSVGPSGTVDSVYVGLIDVAQSLDAGSTWTSIGGPTWSTSAETHNDQHALAAHPQISNLLLVGNDGGIYKFAETLGGVNVWSNLNRFLGVTQFYKSDHHPSDKSVMLGGSQDNATPFSTGDLSHWLCASGGDSGGCAINPANPGTQYATVFKYGYNEDDEECRFEYTHDFWNTKNIHTYHVGSEPISFVGDLTINQAMPFLVYTATDHLYVHVSNPLFHVTNRMSQKLSSTGSVNSIATSRVDADIIYTGATDGELWRSEDGGVTWTEISTGLPGVPIMDIDVHPNDPNDILVALGGVGYGHVWHCEDASAATPSWSERSLGGTSPLPDVMVNSIERSLYGPEDTWWVGTDVGVFLTPDGGDYWLNINPLGLPNVHVNDITGVVGNSHMFAATFGRGMWKINVYDPNDAVIGNSGATARVSAESTTTGTAAVDHPAPDTGTSIHLESDSVAATVPAITYVWFNSEDSEYAIATHQVCIDPVTVHITARLGTSTITYPLIVDPLSNLLAITSYVVTRGEEFEGNVSSLTCTDGESVSIFNDPTSLEASVDLLTSGAPITPSALEFYWTSSVGRLGLSEQLSIRDRITGNYVVQAGRVAPTATTPFKKTAIAAPGRYITPTGASRARLTWRPINDEDPAVDGWLHSLDFAAFRALP